MFKTIKLLILVTIVSADVDTDIASIGNGTSPTAPASCENMTTSDVKLLLYSCRYPTTPVTLTQANAYLIDITSTIVLIVHGWIENPRKEWIADMKNAYLRRSCITVIVVDWEKYAALDYGTSVCLVPKVGRVIAYFFTSNNVPLGKSHLVGHSLGAHISGHAGQAVIRKTGGRKIARITGLDAAGPLYLDVLNANPDSRLSKDDARFVDGIHTDIKMFGYPIDYGTVDFYPNCGFSQPGCPQSQLTTNSTSQQQAYDIIFCSHQRSIHFFIESINSYNFRSYRCLSCALFGTGLCSFNPIVMGENCPTTASGTYFLYTNANSPYARG